jgi:hypothetical protein
MRSLYLWSGGRRARALQWLLALAAGCIVLYVRKDGWVGSWKLGVDWGTGTLIFVGPVCAGAAALTYSTMASRGWDVFVAGMRRGFVSWLGPLVGIWALGVTVMVACTTAALSVAVSLGAHAAPDMLWALPLVSVTLAAEVSLGAVLGVTVHRGLSIPLAALIPFLLESFSVSGPIPEIFRTGGVTGDLSGETYDWRVLLLSAAACAAFTLAFVFSLAFHVFPVRASIGWFAVAAALVCVVPPWWLLESGHDDRYAFVANPRLVCAGEAPQVCLSEDSVRPLPALVREMRRQAAPLVALGIDLPDRWVDAGPGKVYESDGSLSFWDDQAMSSSADPGMVSRALAMPRACADYFNNRVPMRAFRVQGILEAWIATHSGGHAGGVSASSPEGRWLALPVSEQQAWLTSTYAALRECRLRDLTVPFGR